MNTNAIMYDIHITNVCLKISIQSNCHINLLSDCLTLKNRNNTKPNDQTEGKKLCFLIIDYERRWMLLLWMWMDNVESDKKKAVMLSETNAHIKRWNVYHVCDDKIHLVRRWKVSHFHRLNFFCLFSWSERIYLIKRVCLSANIPA